MILTHKVPGQESGRGMKVGIKYPSTLRVTADAYAIIVIVIK